MTVTLRDVVALCDTCKSKYHCQKPCLSPRSEEFFLIILAFYRPQRPLTLPVPSWANLPVIAKSMSCQYKIQVCTLQWHTQAGINTHRKQEDDDQRTDSALKNLTTSPHHQVLIPSHTGVLRFRLKKRNEERPRGRYTLHWFRAEESYTISETHRMWRSLHLLDLFLFTTLVPTLKSWESKKIPSRPGFWQYRPYPKRWIYFEKINSVFY